MDHYISGSANSRLVINLCSCKYDVVAEAAHMLGYTINDTPSEQDQDWDMYWTDLSVLLERVSKLRPYQRLNHFPGMLELCRKAAMSKHLARMAVRCPAEYTFYPTSLIMPEQLDELVIALRRNTAKMDSSGHSTGIGGPTTWIIKPSAGTQGRGIKLVQSASQLPGAEVLAAGPAVAQHYISRPLLLDGFKFDLRIYVLVASVDPLRIYMFDEGLARLATHPWSPPRANNLDIAIMHLTNYAINRDSPGYVPSSNVMPGMSTGSSKRLASVVLQQVAQRAGTTKAALVQAIEGVVVKSLLAVQPLLAHAYHTAITGAGGGTRHANSCSMGGYDHGALGSTPAQAHGQQAAADSWAGAGRLHQCGALPMPSCGCPPSRCFEILGFDIMLDETLQPWLLEVNHSPSFTCDSALDHNVKSALIKSVILAQGQAAGQREAFLEAQARARHERLYAQSAAAGAAHAKLHRPLSALPRDQRLRAAAAVLDELTGELSGGYAASSTSRTSSGPGSTNHTQNSPRPSSRNGHSCVLQRGLGAGVWEGDGRGGAGAGALKGWWPNPHLPANTVHIEIEGSVGFYPGTLLHGCPHTITEPHMVQQQQQQQLDEQQQQQQQQASDQCQQKPETDVAPARERVGLLVQVFPPPDARTKQRYAHIMSAAADAFSEQRCGCAYCIRRARVKALQAGLMHMAHGRPHTAPGTTRGGGRMFASAGCATTARPVPRAVQRQVKSSLAAAVDAEKQMIQQQESQHHQQQQQPGKEQKEQQQAQPGQQAPTASLNSRHSAGAVMCGAERQWGPGQSSHSGAHAHAHAPASSSGTPSCHMLRSLSASSTLCATSSNPQAVCSSIMQSNCQVQANNSLAGPDPDSCPAGYHTQHKVGGCLGSGSGSSNLLYGKPPLTPRRGNHRASVMKPPVTKVYSGLAASALGAAFSDPDSESFNASRADMPSFVGGSYNSQDRVCVQTAFSADSINRNSTHDIHHRRAMSAGLKHTGSSLGSSTSSKTNSILLQQHNHTHHDKNQDNNARGQSAVVPATRHVPEQGQLKESWVPRVAMLSTGRPRSAGAARLQPCDVQLLGMRMQTSIMLKNSYVPLSCAGSIPGSTTTSSTSVGRAGDAHHVSTLQRQW